MKHVVVVDYGLGNLHSVVKALQHEGAQVELSSDPIVVANAERLVLPGVGAFADGMEGLRKRGLVDPLREYARTQRPFLGICLGMQLLLDESEEFGAHAGLGIIPGRVERIPSAPDRKVPQIGWARLVAMADWAGTPLELLAADAMMYFVHSFSAVPEDRYRLADSTYAGARISAAVRRDNVIGLQFHPEKSGPAGLVVLGAYLR
jgi:glutamine amidotransferase